MPAKKVAAKKTSAAKKTTARRAPQAPAAPVRTTTTTVNAPAPVRMAPAPELKSDFPRITGGGFPVDARGKAIGPASSRPETQLGTPEKEAEGKREPEAADINDSIREQFSTPGHEVEK